jgi:hypothetical protein
MIEIIGYVGSIEAAHRKMRKDLGRQIAIRINLNRNNRVSVDTLVHSVAGIALINAGQRIYDTRVLEFD